MFIIKHLIFLLSALLSEIHVGHQIMLPESFEQIFDQNSSLNIISDVDQFEPVFDNNYSEKISKEADNLTEKFHPGPHYEANWTFIDKETVLATFSLYPPSELFNINSTSNQSNNKQLYSTMVSIPSRSNLSIYSLQYYLFTIRQYKTNIEKVLVMEQLILKSTSTGHDEHFSNSLRLIRLNPKEKYSICIYYYQTNSSSQMPDLFICIDIMHDHLKHSSHGLVFVLTQYSIIIGLLIVLQSLYSIRKRRITHIIHQHLINKTQRIRSTFSSVSLVRQSFSSMDTTTNEIKKRNTSSPAIILSESSPKQSDETQPFIKLLSNKNHVHFFCSFDENSDDSESNDSPNDSTFSPSIEPYSDRSDALSSMAHILDSNKPWSKHITPV